MTNSPTLPGSHTPFRILVTGAAGFIGWKVCEFLLTNPQLVPYDLVTNDSVTIQVIGLDNLNDYYDVRLKQWRLQQLEKVNSDSCQFVFHKIDIENYDKLRELFQKFSDSPIHRDSNSPFVAVINLAARAGVRYSMENPFVYYTTNIIGNLNLLELCREFGVKKYILASTSSLYAGQKMPFNESLPVNEPISPYAASKKSGEVTCYTYHKLYDIDVTILRYFTVYGPAGRPDMSIFRFISWIDQNKPVTVYGDGTQSRDFTYVDDIARGTIAALKPMGFEIINLGGDHPHKLMEVLTLISNKLNKSNQSNKPDTQNIIYKPFHPADMIATWADISKAKEILKWQPNVTIEQGLDSTIKWYKDNQDLAKSIKLEPK
jgi:nucleoside-diphosphate-sugar epimerase